MSDESRIAQAIAALTARLEHLGVTEAAPHADQFVKDMLRHGWRPSAPAVVVPLRPGRAVEPPSELLGEARAAMAAVRAGRQMSDEPEESK